MKLIALIRDGAGQLHLVASRAPDLLRREHAARTGRAELIWCGVPPAGASAEAVIAMAKSRLRLIPTGGPTPVSVDAIIRVLVKLTITEPRRRAHRQQWRRRLRSVRSLWSRAIHALLPGRDAAPTAGSGSGIGH